MATRTLPEVRTDNPLVAAAGDLAYGTRAGVPGGMLMEEIAEINKEKYLGSNLQTGTSYTLVLTDAGKIVDLDNAAAIALTIPANSAVAFPVNTRIDLSQYGAGVITVGITTDTLRGDTKSRGQYTGLSLWKRTSTEWILYGGTT